MKLPSSTKQKRVNNKKTQRVVKKRKVQKKNISHNVTTTAIASMHSVAPTIYKTKLSKRNTSNTTMSFPTALEFSPITTQFAKLHTTSKVNNTHSKVSFATPTDSKTIHQQQFANITTTKNAQSQMMNDIITAVQSSTKKTTKRVNHKLPQQQSIADPCDPALITAFANTQRQMHTTTKSSNFAVIDSATTSTPSQMKLHKHALQRIARRKFATSAEGGADAQEDITQGANLVQVQQAVNQWAQLNYRGMEFLRSGTPQDLANAENCFQQCATAMENYPLLPYRSLSLANLASCLMRKGNYLEAIKIFQPLTQQMLLFKQVSLSQIATVHMELASAYELSGQHDNAIKELYVASSRFVHAASHYLGQIQQSDHTHFNAHHRKEPMGDTPDAQNDILREDQRQVAFSQATECWRTALGCRYSAIVLQHRLQNLDFAITELTKLATVYKYVLECVQAVQKYRWDLGEGGIDDTTGNIDASKKHDDSQDVDKRLIPHTDGAKMLTKYPTVPPEAKVVTADLCRLFPDLSLGHLDEFYNRVTVEIVSVLHSLANVYIDQGNFVEACKTLKDSVDIMNPMDESSYLQVASESSKTLRLLYEAILFEHQQVTDPNQPIIVKVTEQSKIKFNNKAEVETTIKLLNQTRAEIFALFTNYLQAHMINTQQSATEDLQHNSQFLEDLPPDAKQFFDFSKDQLKQELESGQFYDQTREIFKKEQGEEYNDDNVDLLLVKPSDHHPPRGKK